MTRNKKSTLAKARAIRDPEKRCIAILKLLPELSADERRKGLRAAAAAARKVKNGARRKALLGRVTRAHRGRKPKRTRPGAGGQKRKGAKRAGSKRASPKRASPKRGTGRPGKRAKHPIQDRPVDEAPEALPHSRIEDELWAIGDELSLGYGPKDGVGRRRPGLNRPPRDSRAGRRAPIFDRVDKVLLEDPDDVLQRDPLPRPIVNLGFSAEREPATVLSEKRSLAAGASYYFWLEIGARVEGSLTDDSARLPIEQLPTNACLDVVLFGNEGGFILGDYSQSIVMSARSQFRVAEPRRIARVPTELLRRRLFFPIEAPWTEGPHRLRCCIYCRGLLVQSYDIEVLVEENSHHHDKAVQTSRLDYALSRTFDPRTLAARNQPEHRLSILFNDDGKGSHAFRFVADQAQYCRSASFDVLEVQDLIDRARRAFREVSWGDPGPWQPGMGYRYEGLGSLPQLTVDLARLAIAGYRNYDAMIDRITSRGERLGELMRRPGIIQLALKESARLILPLSIIYDHRLDVDAPIDAYTLCPTFVHNTGPIDDTPCFRGDCPHRDLEDNHVICPSGFWGFRHEIGVPPSVGSDSDAPEELPCVVECAATPSMVAAVSADPDLRERDAHLANLRRMFGTLTIADTRAAVLEQLRKSGAHVMYFYCHGGVESDRSPFLQVGPSPERIGRSTLRSEGVRWTDPRALVFLNGCHTADLEPERAIELVSGFVQTARGSGVIGTEITVFEPLAVAFAETFMARLLEHATVGAAVRSARLQLLCDWNPLGLLYVPFAMATLCIGARP